MSISYEYLRKMYPEWESKTSPILIVIEIFAAITFVILIPYALMKLSGHDSEDSETEDTYSTEIDDWFEFRKTYQKPK
jgi:hypothetical protein